MGTSRFQYLVQRSICFVYLLITLSLLQLLGRTLLKREGGGASVFIINICRVESLFGIKPFMEMD